MQLYDDVWVLEYVGNMEMGIAIGPQCEHWAQWDWMSFKCDYNMLDEREVYLCSKLNLCMLGL